MERRNARRRHLLPLIIRGLLGNQRDDLVSVQSACEVHISRLNRMYQDDKRVFAGVTLLRSQRHLFEQSQLVRRAEDLVNSIDVQKILQLYDAIELKKHNVGAYRNLQLTGAYAGRIAESVKTKGERIYPKACEAMGMMRNLCFIAGNHGYHRKDHVTRMFLDALGIHPNLVETYLRPLTISGGPVRFEDVGHMSDAKKAKLALARCEKHYRRLSLSQKVVEIAGTLGKLNRVQRLITFDESMHYAADTRSTQNAYADFIGRKTQATWFSERAAEATLTKDWVNAWTATYRRIRNDLETLYDVDFDAIRVDVGREYGYAV